MSLIKNEFQNFMMAMTDNNTIQLSTVQKNEMMKSFYAGAASMFGIMNNITERVGYEDGR